jgi:DNA-binding LytR/AlgR family response regulator
VSPPVLRVLIADDELVARMRLARLLAALPGTTVCGEVSDAQAVLDTVRAGGVDVVLLDIHMPGLSGLDALALLPAGGPQVILITAHTDHALEAFEHGAVDYVLKPVEASRLQKAMDRARARLAPPSLEPARWDRLPIPTRQGIVLVAPDSISHATLEDELVTVFTSQGDYLTDFSLQELVDRLPDEGFYRVHRRALLNLAQVTRLEPLETGGYLARTARGHTVEVSRQSARELRRRLGLLRGGEEDSGA